MIVNMLVCVLLFLCAVIDVNCFSVTTSNPNVEVKELAGVDLKCSYSADFGSNARVEWKFKDTKGSQAYVVFNGVPTNSYSSRVELYGGSNLRFSKVTRQDNGVYTCEVSGSQTQFGETEVKLTVLVPPSPPMCNIPSSVTTDTHVILSCYDGDGSPPPTYKWYKNNVLLPADPSKISNFQNATYRLNEKTGKLVFPRVTKMDSGEYYCESTNKAGPSQKCRALKMEVRDQNTGGIIAAVIIVLLLLVLLGVGIWFAYKKGYLPSKLECIVPFIIISTFRGSQKELM
ncbi:junctional adhesion molecule A-like [Pholidichthys leucotaenia]